MALFLLLLAPLDEAFHSYTPKTNLPVVAHHESEIDLQASAAHLAPHDLPTFEHAHEFLKTLDLGHKKFVVHETLAHANTTANNVINQEAKIVHLDKAEDVVGISDSHVVHCKEYSQVHVGKIMSQPTYVLGTVANLGESEVVKAWGLSKNKRDLHKTRGLLVLRKVTSMELHHKENGCAVLHTAPVLHFELFEHLSVHSVGSIATLRESAKARTIGPSLRSRKLATTDPWFTIDEPLIDCGVSDIGKERENKTCQTLQAVGLIRHGFR